VHEFNELEYYQVGCKHAQVQVLIPNSVLCSLR
jgi:hypothetical protein